MQILQRTIYYGLQPLLLVTVITIWYMDPSFELTYVYTVIAVQILLGVTEHAMPARPDWVIHARQKSINVVLVVLLTLVALVLTTLYVEWLTAPLANLRQAAGLDIWPHHWPILTQLLMVFVASEFI